MGFWFWVVFGEEDVDWVGKRLGGEGRMLRSCRSLRRSALVSVENVVRYGKALSPGETGWMSWQCSELCHGRPEQTQSLRLLGTEAGA